jgi:glycosyltransferase involved in cell wall biosynthesis
VTTHVLGGTSSRRALQSFQAPFPTFQVRALLPVPNVRVALFAAWAWKEVRRITRDGGQWVVHLHSLPWEGAVFTGQRPAVRRVATIHSSGFLDDEAAHKRQWLYRLCLADSDAILAPSRELADKARYVGVAPERIRYIPNGVDPEEYSPAAASHAAPYEIPGLESDSQIVLATRRFDPKNGLLFLVRSMPAILACCPRARLVFAGDGEQLDEVRGACHALSIADKVVFLGNMPRGDLPRLYRRAGVCVLPSLQEATSISGLEAMAMAKPLVGTRIGGIPEIIDDGRTGLLVEPRDPGQLAEALISLLQAPSRAAEMGAAARQRVLREFSWAAIARRTVEVYERLLGQPASALARAA